MTSRTVVRATPMLTGNNAIWNVDLNATEAEIMNLKTGWNLISFRTNKCYYTGTKPQVPMLGDVKHISVTSMKESELLKAIEEKYIMVKGFDLNGAHTYDPTLPDFINDL